MSRTTSSPPGFVTVAGAGEHLHLAPRTVRDLIYSGRLPSTRLGRRHYLRLTDVEDERRRRMGLPVRLPRPAARRSRSRPRSTGRPELRLVPAQSVPSTRSSASHQAAAETRRRRAAERRAQFERWLRAGQRPEQPAVPFVPLTLDRPSTCAACERRLRAGTRAIDAPAFEGRPAGRLCVTCGRRALLAWADERRREATAARTLARDLGVRAPSAKLAA